MEMALLLVAAAMLRGGEVHGGAGTSTGRSGGLDEAGMNVGHISILIWDLGKRSERREGGGGGLCLEERQMVLAGLAGQRTGGRAGV